MDIRKQTKLIELLKRLGDTSYSESAVLHELDREIRAVKESIPDPIDLSPYYKDVRMLEGKYASLSMLLNVMNETLKDARLKLNSTVSVDKFDSLSEEILTIIKDLRKELEKLGIEVRKPRGGGSIHRKLLNNSVEIATRYADLNLIGSGVTITVADDNTKKVTNVTLTASGSSGISVLIPTGSLNQGTFVFSSAPTLISVDQGRFMQKVSTDGTVNWTGTTTVALSVWPTSDIFGLG